MSYFRTLKIRAAAYVSQRIDKMIAHNVEALLQSEEFEDRLHDVIENRVDQVAHMMQSKIERIVHRVIEESVDNGDFSEAVRTEVNDYYADSKIEDLAEQLANTMEDRDSPLCVAVRETMEDEYARINRGDSEPTVYETSLGQVIDTAVGCGVVNAIDGCGNETLQQSLRQLVRDEFKNILATVLDGAPIVS
jgi:uncharacterized membrane protein YheB (UPF0754 family)